MAGVRGAGAGERVGVECAVVSERMRGWVAAGSGSGNSVEVGSGSLDSRDAPGSESRATRDSLATRMARTSTAARRASRRWARDSGGLC